MKSHRLGRVALLATMFALFAALLPGTSRALPFDHIIIGAGIPSNGDRLAVLAYDDIALGDFGAAILRTATSTGPALEIPFDCATVSFLPGPSHFFYGSGSAGGKTYHIGIFDDTSPFGAGGPYDAVSITTTAGSGPCGTSAPYPNGWLPVGSGDFLIGP